ncbi:hypothetical protein BASA81_007769 [Batrachochytrium salamandrivorans]|nr:hypothetical protein BASA81_007769 [Batrachochytrium salamandrivorans]
MDEAILGLPSKSKSAKLKALDRLYEKLSEETDEVNLATAKLVLDNQAAMEVLLDLCQGGKHSHQAVAAALDVLSEVCRNEHHARRVFVHHLGPVITAVTLGIQSNAEEVQESALVVLCELAGSVENCTELIDHADMVPLLLGGLKHKSLVEYALETFCNLSTDKVHAKLLVDKHPTVLPTLLSKLLGLLTSQTKNKAYFELLALSLESVSNLVGDEGGLDHVELSGLLVSKLENAKCGQDVHEEVMVLLGKLSVARDTLVVDFPQLVGLVVGNYKLGKSPQLQLAALDLLSILAANQEGKKELQAKFPDLVSLLVAQDDSDKDMHAVAQSLLQVLSIKD